MKTVAALVACLLVVAGGIVAFNWQRGSLQVDAQESAKELSVDRQRQANNSDRKEFGRFGDRPYPTFFVDEVISRLKTAAEELIEKKLAKNSDELRKNLDQTTFSMTLPLANENELSSRELYQRASESVFLVAGLTRPTEEETDWKTAFSTAFVVHEDGILSTSAHVFDHEDHDHVVVVLDVRGNVYPVVEIVAANRKADTLLFRIAAKGLKSLPLGKDAAPGTPVRVMGHPGDSFFFFSAGHIANYERDDEGLSWLNVTADFGQGSSGGPVMDESGNVIGQVSRTYTLYAGGETSHRGRRRRSIQKNDDGGVKAEAMNEGNDDEANSKKTADPQMVFKACTPVSAIRSLVK